MHPDFSAVPVPAWKVRAGDLIHRGDAVPTERIVAIDNPRASHLTVRTEFGAFVAVARDEITLRMPVGRPAGGIGLYKADGSGPFGCVCVYRAPSGGQPHDLVHEVDDCPSHGSAYYDDEE